MVAGQLISLVSKAFQLFGMKTLAQVDALHRTDLPSFLTSAV